MHSYSTLLNAVAPIMALVLVGFFLRRIGWLSIEADNSLLRLSVNLLAPALIFDSVVGNPALRQPANLLLPPLVGFCTVTVGFLLALYIARRLNFLPEEKQQRTFAFSTGIYNYGYIAIPLVQTLFGRETMGVLFVHNLGVEIAFWSVGIFILTAASPSRAIKNMVNGPTLAIVFSLALNLIGASGWIPSFATGTIHMLGQSAVPLALILTGATLADLISQTRTGTAMPVSIGSSLLRLLILPVLFLLLAEYLPCSPELKQVIVIQAAMPAAMLPIILSKHYGGDPAIAIQVVIPTTLLGLFTIPLWIKLGFYFVAP